MNKILFIGVFTLFTVVTSIHVQAETQKTVSTSAAEATTNTTKAKEPSNQPVCLISGVPPKEVNFTVVKRLKLGKGTYGSVEELLPKFGNIARKYHADGIIEYNGSQRFGFWPWRVVRPVVTGSAVKFQTPVDCKTLNGQLI